MGGSEWHSLIANKAIMLIFSAVWEHIFLYRYTNVCQGSPDNGAGLVEIRCVNHFFYWWNTKEIIYRLSAEEARESR